MSGKKNRNCQALQCIPGEYIQEVAGHVRKRVSSRDGEGYIQGTLYCTNLRVAFLPSPSPSTEDCSCRPFMHSDYDVAFPCIGRLVAVNSFTKAKVLTRSSTLKFIPEELIICCRDFRVLRFRFHESGLEPQAFRVTMAIAQAQEGSSWDRCYENAVLKNLENSQLNRQKGEPEGEFPVLLFETFGDWEKELMRLGATGWRVSPVNERFDMCTSLPKYLWVPSRFLDNELKRAFVHFNERRIPRLCWHHPGGSDLLRAASFHAESDPEKEDLRSVETLMLAGHSQCVIVEAAADLPSPPEIQQAYSRLWNLCLCLADSSAATSDEKWLSSLEGTRWLDHVRACLKKASEVAMLLAERSRSVILQESDDRDLNCLLASLVQVLSDPHMRTISGFQSLVQKEWVAAGHPFLQRLNPLQKNDRDESPVFLLFLDCIWQLLQQFPQSFEFTEAYLVALHDSTYVPFSSTFLFNCQWERGRKNQLQNRFLNQLYTPINGWRETICLEILQNGVYPVQDVEGAHLPTTWEWPLRYTPRQRAQFCNPCHSGGSRGALNGNFLTANSDKMEKTPLGKCSLFVFAKGSLTLQTHYFPWKNGSLSKKGCWWAQPSEGPAEQEKPLARKSSDCLLYYKGLLLLPSHAGPLISLWKRCYLRGDPEVQVKTNRAVVKSHLENGGRSRSWILDKELNSLLKNGVQCLTWPGSKHPTVEGLNAQSLC
ncbi:myotubularin-related protein 11 isoform X1 [Varanus komodoensis]|uniref:myotubularin-related protein 11 isoform X1 n=1 Tax=Varanus komodoensis TaxID=61221 RepID=UPI001CF78D7C|nr:myotubularin-related protein 11 isoform X1 [Varanus komodoensis]XP_044305176.1 myotubularin-related protein 11 isoform X1 [Varanus komodoensis]